MTNKDTLADLIEKMLQEIMIDFEDIKMFGDNQDFGMLSRKTYVYHAIKKVMDKHLTQKTTVTKDGEVVEIERNGNGICTFCQYHGLELTYDDYKYCPGCGAKIKRID